MSVTSAAKARLSWRVVRQVSVSRRRVLLSRLVAVGLALIFIAAALELAGYSSLALGAAVLRSAVGSSYALQQALILGTPIILTGIGVAVSMRMGVWNIGAEGQLFLGAFFAAIVGLNVNLPTGLSLVLMLLAGAFGGALWALLPALARAYAEVNEIITTLLLNFVAVLFVRHVVNGSMRDMSLGELFASPKIPYELPTLFGSRLHIGILIAILLAFGLGLFLKYSRWGYEVTIIGGNRRAAEFAGMRVIPQTFLVFLLSGAIAGIAGMVEVAGTAHRLSGAVSLGYGYLGLIAAVLAANSPIGIVLVGALYAALLNAGIVLQTQGLSIHFVLVITGTILLFATMGEVVSHYSLHFERGAPEPGAVPVEKSEEASTETQGAG